VPDPSQQYPKMTVEEFLTWDDGTDTRYELVNGEVRAMAAPDSPHRTILINIGGEIRQCLRGRAPCRTEAEAAVRIDDETLWQADLVVTCGPNSKEIVEPQLIIEIQSPSTRRIDLGDKLDDYKQLPSVQEIWMVDSARRRVQVWRRVGERWMGEDHIGGSEFQSETVGGEPFVLDVIYENSGL
jgi:Uma2 family endonuclease